MYLFGDDEHTATVDCCSQVQWVAWKLGQALAITWNQMWVDYCNLLYANLDEKLYIIEINQLTCLANLHSYHS